MLRFWSSDARGGDQATEAEQNTMQGCSKDLPNIATSPCSLKRRMSSVDNAADLADGGFVKRARVDYSVATPPETPAMPRQEYFASQSPCQNTQAQATLGTDRIVDIINQQFGTEILLKHQEMRFINQELAKCQIALEQLRRCHLIPYPTTCPTPQQMLDIADGKNPAVQSKNGDPAAQWAPPFGVVDGPYARHYAKWLIPDAKFDGILPEWQGVSGVSRNLVEGRTTRNSLSEANTIGKRVARGQTGQKPTAGYPPQKAKAPIIMKRSDGVTVKLVCNVCHREDFHSTQGFINHCRIAHRKEFKSHEDAAIHCGHPITASEGGGVGGEDRPSGIPASGNVHPLAQADATAEQNAYAALLSRIDGSLKQFHEGRLPGAPRTPLASYANFPVEVERKPSKSFVGSPATPFLSQLLHNRSFKGNLNEHVEDAKTKMGLDELEPGDEYDEGDQPTSLNMDETAKNKASSAGGRVPAMRVPSRAVAPTPTPGHPNCTSRSPHLSFAQAASKRPSASTTAHDDDDSSYDESTSMDIDRSPNTVTSNNAPSLVSDDGGDDDSDDGSSETSDTGSMSDVAEVNIEYPEVHDLSQHGRGTNAGAKLKKHESRHVTFVTPLTGKSTVRRKPKV